MKVKLTLTVLLATAGLIILAAEWRAPGAPPTGPILLPPSPSRDVRSDPFAPRPLEPGSPSPLRAGQPQPTAEVTTASLRELRERGLGEVEFVVHGGPAEADGPPGDHESVTLELHAVLEGAPWSEVERILDLDERGRAVALLEPGGHTAFAWSSSWASEPVSFSLGVTERLTVHLTLVAGAAVEGVVLDAESMQPVSGASVGLPWRAPGDLVATDASGSFRYPRFPVGDAMYKLYAFAEGYGTEQAMVKTSPSGSWLTKQLEPGASGSSGQIGPARVTFLLPPEASYAGWIVDEQGSLVDEALVEARGYYTISERASSLDRATATSDRKGRFLLDGLRGDIRHLVTVSADGFARSTFDPSGARAGETCGLGPLVLRHVEQLDVIVTDTAGLPAAGLAVDAYSPVAPVDVECSPSGNSTWGPRSSDYWQSTHTESTRTDVDGVARFRGLAIGKHRVSVRLGQGSGFAALTSKIVEVGAGHGERVEYLMIPSDLLTVRGRLEGPPTVVEGAPVEAMVEGRHVAFLSTDHEGRFWLPGLTAGSSLEFEVIWASGAGERWSGVWSGRASEALRGETVVVTLKQGELDVSALQVR